MEYLLFLVLLNLNNVISLPNKLRLVFKCLTFYPTNLKTFLWIPLIAHF